MKIKFAVLLVAAIAFVCSPVWAGTITFNLGSCSQVTSPTPCHTNVDLGTNTATYTVGTSAVVATGFASSGTSMPNDLFIKNTAMNPGETGLGLFNDDGMNEINVGQYVYLNLSDIAGTNFSGTLEISSAQTGEGATVCVTNAVGTPGSTCQSMMGPGTDSILTFPVAWNAKDDILSITATDPPDSITPANVLVGDSFTANTVPEPASLSLFGIGLLGMAFLFRKRIKATA